VINPNSLSFGFISRIFYVGLTAISLPILIDNLGVQAYSVYVGLSSYIVIVLAFDMGVSSLAINLVSDITDLQSLRQKFQNLFLTVSIISMIQFLVLGIIAYLKIPQKLFHLQSFNQSSNMALWFLFNFLLALTLTVAVIPKIYFGLQKSNKAFAIIFFGNGMSLLGTLLISQKITSVMVLLICQLVIQNCIYLILGNHLRSKFELKSKFCWSDYFLFIRENVKSSLEYLVIQLVSVFSIQLIPILIFASSPRINATKAVTSWKILMFPISLATFFFFPLWAEISALSKKDALQDFFNTKMKSLVSRTISVVLIGVIFIYLAGPKLVSFLTADQIRLLHSTALLMATFLGLNIINQPILTMLYGLKELGFIIKLLFSYFIVLFFSLYVFHFAHTLATIFLVLLGAQLFTQSIPLFIRFRVKIKL
jgi:hypothetical protein